MAANRILSQFQIAAPFIAVTSSANQK